MAIATSASLCQCAVFLLLLASLHQPQVSAGGEYSRTVSYQNEIIVRCPNREKATVQVLRDHSDVWSMGKESIDMRVNRQAYARVQEYFPECTVLIADLEAHVQAAEQQMFPKKAKEQEAWIQSVVEAVVPGGDLKQCEEKKAQIQQALAMDKSWFEEYHNYDAIVEWYQILQQSNPDLVRFNESIGKTLEGRDMPSVHITGSASNPDKKKFWIQCQIHAREWISGAVCMYLAKYLVDSYQVDPKITDIMDNMEIVMVPFVNPDGYAYTWTNDRMWRKNRHRNPLDAACTGVDINRNYPEGFKYKSTSCVDDYGGPEALSELETQHIVNYFRENAPILGSIDFHSYGQLLLRPYGHTNATSPDEEFHKTLGAEMKDIIKEKHGTEYSNEHSYDLYFCYGIAADWLYSEDAASTNGGYRSASFCIELRDTSSGFQFMLPAYEIIPTAEEMVPAVVHYMEKVLAHPLLYSPPSSTTAAADMRTLFQVAQALFRQRSATFRHRH